jgi:hypothetical protein
VADLDSASPCLPEPLESIAILQQAANRGGDVIHRGAVHEHARFTVHDDVNLAA